MYDVKIKGLCITIAGNTAIQLQHIVISKHEVKCASNQLHAETCKDGSDL